MSTKDRLVEKKRLKANNAIAFDKAIISHKAIAPHEAKNPIRTHVNASPGSLSGRFASQFPDSVHAGSFHSNLPKRDNKITGKSFTPA